MARLKQMVDYIETNGLLYTLSRSLEKLHERLFHTWDRKWKKLQPDETILSHQRETVLNAGLISILVPVYNTRPAFLRDLVSSFLAQTYVNWEACLWSTGNDPNTEAALEEVAKMDRRIRIFKSDKNEGISGNTNQAFYVSRGDWIVLCDHDDILTPDALWRMAKEILTGNADMIYTDEDKITEDGSRHTDPHFKPDFCPDTLSSQNYICHLLGIKRSLMMEVNGECSSFDGSQDHDLALRCSEKTDRILHIPYICYHWRSVGDSFSHSKNEACLDAACRAVTEHMNRIGYSGTAIPNKGTIRLRYHTPFTTTTIVILAEHQFLADQKVREIRKLAWENVSITTAITNHNDRYRAMNAAAAGAETDFILFLDASVSHFSIGFLEELKMYSQRNDVGAVIPLLSDKIGRVVHAGYGVSLDGQLCTRSYGLPSHGGGWHQMLHISHNIGSCAAICVMVRRQGFLPFDESWSTLFGAADWSARMTRSGMHLVFTPHASAICSNKSLILPVSGNECDRFARQWSNWKDPCWNQQWDPDKADYSLRRI